MSIINRFNEAGIKINCQLVLVPYMNDGDELVRTLTDLTGLENAECIAAVPVGLTGHRQGLAELSPFCKEIAQKVLEIIDGFGEKCLEKYGQRRVFAADEFYILAQKQIPSAEYYEDFLQLENGVGLVALLLDEVNNAIKNTDYILEKKRIITIATGEAAYPFILQIVDKITAKWDNLECRVKAIKNNFFGGQITVSGLVTAQDIEKQLSNQELGEQLLIPSVMLREQNDMFLDSVTTQELSKRLGVPIIPVNNDGYELLSKILGQK